MYPPASASGKKTRVASSEDGVRLLKKGLPPVGLAARVASYLPTVFFLAATAAVLAVGGLAYKKAQDAETAANAVVSLPQLNTTAVDLSLASRFSAFVAGIDYASLKGDQGEPGAVVTVNGTVLPDTLLYQRVDALNATDAQILSAIAVDEAAIATLTTGVNTNTASLVTQSTWITDVNASATSNSALIAANTASLAVHTGLLATHTSQIGALEAAAGNSIAFTAGEGLFVPSGWGKHWKAALSTASTGLATIALLGDSITHGMDSSNLLHSALGRSYACRLRTSLQSLYGDGGSGYQGTQDMMAQGGYTAASRGMSTTGTWSARLNQGCASNYYLLASAAATITFTNVRGTSIDIWYAQSTTMGSFTYSIDGAAAVTVNAAIAGDTAMAATATGLSVGEHTVLISWVSGFNAICGVSGRFTTGVIMHNFGVQATTSGSIIDTSGSPQFGNAVDFSGGVSAMTASLIIYAYGVNDAHAIAGGATTSTAFVQNLAVALSRWRGTNGAPVDFLVVAPHIGNWQLNTVSYYAMMAEARSLCAIYGAAFISIGASLKNSWQYARDLNYWSNTQAFPGDPGNDAVHPSDVGHLIMANIILPVVNNTVAIV